MRNGMFTKNGYVDNARWSIGVALIKANVQTRSINEYVVPLKKALSK